MQQIDLKDEITFIESDRPGIQFDCHSKDIPEGEENLCLQAAHIFSDAAETQSSVRITLHKVIPVGAGLGGGSSNAAVTLLGLNRFWNVNFPAEKLIELAAQLGSDVPFFIQGGMAIARGRGELLEHCDFGFNRPILLVYPQIHISTKWAYKQLNLGLTKTKKNSTFASFNNIDFNNIDFYTRFENQFETPIFQRFPILKNIKQEMVKNGAGYVSMSGSGSTIFGIFRELEEAVEAQKKIQSPYPVFIAKPIRSGFDQMLL